jgi:hypothetical protein
MDKTRREEFEALWEKARDSLPPAVTYEEMLKEYGALLFDLVAPEKTKELKRNRAQLADLKRQILLVLHDYWDTPLTSEHVRQVIADRILACIEEEMQEGELTDADAGGAIHLQPRRT